MRGKLWDDLKPSYRARLRSAGISKGQHNKAVRAGKPLSARTAARGHKETPEHPGRIHAASNRNKYQEYRNRRTQLIRRVAQIKRELWGDTRSFNAARSEKYVEHYPKDKSNPHSEKTVPIDLLRQVVDMYEDGDLEIWWEDDGKYDDDFAFLYYH